MRGGLPTAVPTDPTIYRFYEVLQVYGGAINELIHEEFGDGIMSAINFSVNVEKKPHPAGDRVVVTFDGKFLPYDRTALDTVDCEAVNSPTQQDDYKFTQVGCVAPTSTRSV